MEEIKVYSEYLADYRDHKQSVNNSFSELEDVILQIKQELIQEGWKGESKNKCVDVLRMTEDYVREIYGLYEEINSAVEKLENCAETFDNDATVMKVLKTL